MSPQHSRPHHLIGLLLGATLLSTATIGAAQQIAPVVERSWERGTRPILVIERSWTRPPDSVAEGTVLVKAISWPAAPQRVPTEEQQPLALSEPEPTPYAAAHEAPRWLAAARPVADSAMAELRGGFVMPDGLKVSFGIERVVMINGVLASTTTLNLTDLGKLVGTGGGNVPPAIANSLAVIQNGPNNLFTGDVVNASGFATVIQNSLDNQRIQTITTINTQVNSGELMRAHRFGEALRDVMLR